MSDRKPIYQNKGYEIARKQIEMEESLIEEDVKKLLNKIGQKFAKARLEKGYSLRNVDQIIGKNVRGCLTSLEVGSADVNPSIKTLLLIAYSLDISYEELFNDEYDSADKIEELIRKLPVEEKKKVLKALFNDVI